MAIPVILSTGSLYTFDVDTTMALAAGTGFDGIELMVDWRRETHHPDHLRTLVDRHGLPILAVHSPFIRMFGGGWPTDSVASIKRSVQLAETLGAQTVVVHPPGRWIRFQWQVVTPYRSMHLSVPLPVARPGKLGRWLWQVLPDFQTQTPVKIAIENMPCRWLGPLKLEPHHCSQPQTLRQFQYLTFDTTHVGTRRVNLLDFYRQVESQVAHIHLSNFNGRQHQLPHNGALPLTEFLGRLSRQNFGGLISLELGPDSLQANDETRLRQNLQESLLFCRRALANEVGSR